MHISNLGLTVAAAFGVQAFAGAIAIRQQTERFYDATGALTFVGCTVLSLYLPALRARTALPSLLSFHPRQLIASGFCVLWAARLGSFLAERVHRTGDSRFDEIKKSPARFAVAWFAQGAWVSLTALPVFAINAIPAALQPRLGPRDAFAAALWLGAFGFEVIADRQKSAWRAGRESKAHDEKFISSGLWSISRHPNYVGEIGLWTAQAFAASTLLSSPLVSGKLFPVYAAYAMFASPLAEYALINFVSGVPLLEASADKRFGDDPKYIEYKNRVPVFFPIPKLF